jgi:heme-degrading monooxygenase HmoA
MISLHVYLTPKAGRERELDAAVRDEWLAAMSEQPGFLSAAVAKPFSDEELDGLGALKPGHALEAISFWRSEGDRLAWVARPIHDQVFAKVIEASESVTYTLQTVEQGWGL